MGSGLPRQGWGKFKRHYGDFCTGADTIVESVRFAFNLDSERVAKLTLPDGWITKTLGAGSVRCTVEVEENGRLSEYTIDREMDGAPRVLLNGRDPLGDDVLHDIEIYSQGALQQIASADKPQLRLQLIDRSNKTAIVQISKGIHSRIAELKTLGSRLRIMRNEIDKHKLAIRDLDQLRAELGRSVESRPELPPTLEEQHTLYLQRQRLLETLNEVEALQRKAVFDLAAVLANRDTINRLRTALEQFSAIEPSASGALIEELDSAVGAVAKSRDEISSIPISDHTRRLTARFEKENEAYYHLRQQQQVLSQSLKHEDAVRRHVVVLEKSERELKELESQRDELTRRRRTVRAEVTQMRDTIFEMRVNEG